MNTQVIITKEPNQVIPRGYLQTALKQFPSCIGITIQDVVENEPVLDVSIENRTMNVDDLMKIVESCKDVRMVIVLGNMSQDFDPESDIQPYVFQQAVEGEDPQNILAFHCEGDFPNYAKPGKGHTDEYNYWEDFVYPTVLEKFEASPDSLDQFFARLSSSAMKQALENPIGHRGVVVFVPLVGDIIAYGRNGLGGKFEWGTTSQTLGWGTSTKIEAAAETAIAAVKKTGGRLAKLMGTAAPAPSTATSVPQTEKPTIKTDDKGIHHTSGTDPFAAWPGTSSKTHTMMRPPTGLQGNAKNRWIRLFLNLSPQAELPKNKDHSNFMIPVANALVGYAQEEVTTNDAVKQLADKVKQFHGPAGDPVSQQMAEAHEEKNPPKRPASQPEGDQRPTADFLPECPAEEAKASAELVAEWATNPKQPTSLEVQKIESKWPLFTVSRGIKLENVARWSIAEKKLFTKRCPNDAARLISELVLKLHEFGAFEPQVEVQPDKSDKGKGGTPPQPGPSQTEKTPAPSGKKTSRLARLTGSAA